MSTDELRRLLGEATPGPWEAEEPRVLGGWVIRCRSGERPAKTNGLDVVEFGGHGGGRAEADASLIAAAVNALPLLLDVAEAAGEYIDAADAESGQATAQRALRKALAELETP